MLYEVPENMFTDMRSKDVCVSVKPVFQCSNYAKLYFNYVCLFVMRMHLFIIYRIELKVTKIARHRIDRNINKEKTYQDKRATETVR